MKGSLLCFSALALLFIITILLILNDDTLRENQSILCYLPHQVIVLMRKLLASEKGERKKFRAVFSRFGKKANYQGYADRTVLLLNIMDAETNNIVTDHVWFSYTKGFEKINLKPGLQVEFEARIKAYKKGYVNRKYNIDNSQLDFKLSHPTRISIINH